VDVELGRRECSRWFSNVLVLLLEAPPPSRLEPGVIGANDPPHALLPSAELPHFHAISGPLFPPEAMSARCLGGGSGGGTGSRAFGIDIGIDVGEATEW